MMTGVRLAFAGGLVLAGIALPGAAAAQETGIAAIHSWVTVGRKTCMATHTHDGSGTGKTKKLAERAAIQSWESFTIWEYGTPWGRYSLSESKRLTCDRATSGDFSCHVNSRPCVMRGGRPIAKRKKQ